MPGQEQMKCPHCGEEMKTVAAIAPTGPDRPGLLAFLCPRCGAARSELIPPNVPERGD